MIASIWLMIHYVAFILSINKNIIEVDIKRWCTILNLKINAFSLFILLMDKKEFRNLFYYRIGKPKYLLNIISPKLDSLYLPSKRIGKGLYIEHGFSSIIAAESIGDNCWINQQVTIGYKNRVEGPQIGNNVIINAGAIVIGNITIGNNVIVGAGAVVTKSLPCNCTVVGNPAKIIKMNGKRVDIKL